MRRRVLATIALLAITAVSVLPSTQRGEAGRRTSKVNSVKRPSKPESLAKFDHPSRISMLPNGKLIAAFLRAHDKEQDVAARFSDNNGRTWGEPQLLVKLPETDGVFGGPEVLVDRDGEVQLFFTNFANANSGRTVADRRIDIWHTKSVGGRQRWQQPKRIWEGYTGSLNSVIQLRSGRILLPFSYVTHRSWRERGQGAEAFTYMGNFDCTLVYSDDSGTTWRRSPAALKVQAPTLSTYGAIEPVVLELKDGQVWMLIRTQLGRFYESFSKDGIDWSAPRPSSIVSSDSPAGLVRLDDGRVVLFWNNSLRFPYAFGGRHVLHAAISQDDGKTWRGYREVAHDPLNDQPPPTGGDHGTAYPFPHLAKNGKVIFSSGQGEGRRFNALLDPEWLYETSQRADFSSGLSDWSVFGTKGVSLVPNPEKPGAQLLSIRKSDPDWSAAAVWNFPAGTTGHLRLRIMPKRGFQGMNIGLTDHYSVPFDPEDIFNNLYNVQLTKRGNQARGINLIPDRWHDLELAWDGTRRTCRVLLDGRLVAMVPLLRQGTGVNYLRLRSTAEKTDNSGVLIEKVEADVSESY